MDSKGTWILAAECGNRKEESVINFFSESKREQKKAISLCRTECPVQRECLQHALDKQELHGTWGGCTEQEIRVALAVDENGDTHLWDEPLLCPLCRSPWVSVMSKKRIRMTVTCDTCDLTWERRRVIRQREKLVIIDIATA